MTSVKAYNDHPGGEQASPPMMTNFIRRAQKLKQGIWLWVSSPCLGVVNIWFGPRPRCRMDTWVEIGTSLQKWWSDARAGWTAFLLLETEMLTEDSQSSFFNACWNVFQRSKSYFPLLVTVSFPKRHSNQPWEMSSWNLFTHFQSRTSSPFLLAAIFFGAGWNGFPKFKSSLSSLDRPLSLKETRIMVGGLLCKSNSFRSYRPNSTSSFMAFTLSNSDHKWWYFLVKGRVPNLQPISRRNTRTTRSEWMVVSGSHGTAVALLR